MAYLSNFTFPHPFADVDFPDTENAEDPPMVRGQRQVRDVLDHQAVNDYVSAQLKKQT